jgi:hypothetical protein
MACLSDFLSFPDGHDGGCPVFQGCGDGCQWVFHDCLDDTVFGVLFE